MRTKEWGRRLAIVRTNLRSRLGLRLRRQLKQRPPKYLGPLGFILMAAAAMGIQGCLALSAMRQPSLAQPAASPPQYAGSTLGIGERYPLYAQRNDAAGWSQPEASVAPRTFFRQVSENSWRSRIPAASLYPLVLRQLSGSYIILANDARSMSIQTDWDKFFVGGRLFRNRLSVSLFPISTVESELVVMNKVEYFRSPEERSGMGEADWIPTQDVTNEKVELIESLSRIAQAMRVAQAR